MLSDLMGAAAKIFASTLTYPYQVIKSRLQQRDPIVSLTNNENLNMNKNMNMNMNSNSSIIEGDIGIHNRNIVTGINEVVQPRYTGTLDCVTKIWR